MEAIHSRKPIRENASSLTFNLAQLHKLHTKKFFNFCTFNIPPLKANLFLSFHTVQKIHMEWRPKSFSFSFPQTSPSS